MEREWKCGECGEWVSTKFMRHHHLSQPAPRVSFDEPENTMTFEATSNMTVYTRKHEDPVRNVVITGDGK